MQKNDTNTFYKNKNCRYFISISITRNNNLEIN